MASKFVARSASTRTASIRTFRTLPSIFYDSLSFAFLCLSRDGNKDGICRLRGIQLEPGMLASSRTLAMRDQESGLLKTKKSFILS